MPRASEPDSLRNQSVLTHAGQPRAVSRRLPQPRRCRRLPPRRPGVLLVGTGSLRVVVAAAAAALAAASAVAAQAASVTVRNLGQPGLESSRPQEPQTATSRGDCRRVFLAAHANGTRRGCPTGTWPRTGAAAWGPVLAFATGDTLELRFDRPMSRVTVSSTTDGPGSLTPAYRRGWIERQLYGPAGAAPTPDPAVWRVGLPDPLEPLVHRTGATLAIVAEDAGRAYDFALLLRTPRPDVHGSSDCTRAWYSPRGETSTCTLTGGMPMLSLVRLRPRARTVRGRAEISVRTARGALVVLSLHRGGRTLARRPPRLQTIAGDQAHHVRLPARLLRRLRGGRGVRLVVRARACYDICRPARATVVLRG